MVQISFDANQVKPSEGFEAIPTDEYTLAISSSEIKKLSSGEGARLAVTISVVDGPMAGRMIFDGFNIQHPDSAVCDRAQRDLSALCHAIAVYQVNDTSQLHGVPFRAKVKLTPAEGKYDASNSVDWSTAPKLTQPQNNNGGNFGGGQQQQQQQHTDQNQGTGQASSGQNQQPQNGGFGGGGETQQQQQQQQQPQDNNGGAGWDQNNNGGGNNGGGAPWGENNGNG